MRLPKVRDYPKELVIGGDIWTIRFARKLDPKNTVRGDADPSKNEIRILTGLGPEESFRTLIHEVIHAFEFSYDLDIDTSTDHPLIYCLEDCVFNLLKDNF